MACFFKRIYKFFFFCVVLSTPGVLLAQGQHKHQLFVGVDHGAFPVSDMKTIGMNWGYTYAISKNLGATLRFVQHQSYVSNSVAQTASLAVEGSVQVYLIHFNRLSLGIEGGGAFRDAVDTYVTRYLYVDGENLRVVKQQRKKSPGFQVYLLAPVRINKRFSLITRAGYGYFTELTDVFDLATGLQVKL